MEINVTVGRLDNAKVVSVQEDATIEDALVEGGFTIATGEIIQDLENNKFDADDQVSVGGQYFLVKQNKNK